MNKKNRTDNKIKFEWLIAFMAGLLASMPLLLKGVDGAGYQDLAFHLSRIEGIKEGLLAGKFPVMMQSVWMAGKGYPVSIFYGDALLYFPALLRVCGIPVIAAYKLFILVLNVATALVAYICLDRIFNTKLGAAFGTVVYMTASYRFVDVYIRNATGEYGAFLFFPVVALAIYKILSEEKPDRKTYFKNSILLSAGMTGLIETHLLSTVMTVFLLAIVCILYAKRSFRPGTLATIGLAVVETLLLNLYYIVPFLNYYMNEPIYGGRGAGAGNAMQIRGSGAYLSQLVSFFQNPFGSNVPDVEYRMQLTVGLPLLIVLVVCFILYVCKIRKYRTFVLGYMSVLTIWMSTNLFPWNSLEGYTHLFKLLSKVQFPWRYLAPAIMFLTLLFCDVFSRMEKEKSSVRKITFAVSGIIVVIATAMTVVFTIQYKTGYTMVDYTDYSEVDSGYMGACEYLKTNVSLSELSYVPTNEVFEEYEVLSVKDNTVCVYVENGKEENNLEIDKLNYTGYVAVTESGERLKIFDGYNDLITVIVPAGYSGNITVTFKQPVYWIVCEIISLLSLLGLILLALKDRRKAR